MCWCLQVDWKKTAEPSHGLTAPLGRCGPRRQEVALTGSVYLSQVGGSRLLGSVRSSSREGGFRYPGQASASEGTWAGLQSAPWQL